jgi:NAD(P)H-hydrate epimerase
MDIPEVTVEQMMEVDRLMVEDIGISLLQMMENAGRILAGLTIKMHAPSQVTVLAGKGNNGGGGLVAARYLRNRGVGVRVVMASEDIGDVPLRHLSTLRAMDVPVGDRTGHDEDVIIDALLGYNQRGEPRGRVAELMSETLASGVPVLCLDVPSGFDMSTGTFHTVSFRGSPVLTLGLPKANMRGAIDELWLADIGIPREVYGMMGLRVPIMFRDTDHFRL